MLLLSTFKKDHSRDNGLTETARDIILGTCIRRRREQRIGVCGFNHFAIQEKYRLPGYASLPDACCA